MLKFRINKHQLVLLTGALLIILFFTDIILKYCAIYDVDMFRLSRLLRGAFLVFSISVIFYHTSQNYRILKIYISLLLLFFILKLFTFEDDLGEWHLVPVVKLFAIPMCYYGLKALLRGEDITKLCSMLSIKFYLYGAAVFIGLIFSIEILRTYPFSFRSGYSGALFSPNEATFFFHIMIFYFFILSIKCGKSVLFWLSILIGLIIGTKGILIPVLLFVGFKVYKAFSVKYILILMVAVVGLVLLYLCFPQNQETIKGFTEIFERDGLVNAISSGRWSQVKCFFTQEIQAWNTLNFFIGRTNLNCWSVESDPFYVLLESGFVGLILAYAPYIYIYKDQDFYGKIFLISCLFVGILTGHYVYSSINMIIFPLTLILTKRIQYTL